MTSRWVDCDRSAVSKRYDRICGLIPFFDRLLFLPRDLRRRAVETLALRSGDSVLEIGCGTGNSLPYLQAAVGSAGRVYGIDISSGMLRKASARRAAHHWNNVVLNQCDAADYTAPEVLDGVLFSLSYNTMPHHKRVLRGVWNALRPGGRLVIMDAKLPSGPASKLLVPFSVWLMKRTMLGNPFIQPWKELAAVAGPTDMSERLFGSYYICRATKAANDEAVADAAHRIAAE